MTTNLTELAGDPQAFDTELARLHTELAKARAALNSRMDDVYRAAGARRKSTRRGLVWDASYDAAHVKVLAIQPELINQVRDARAHIETIEHVIASMDRAYAAQATPWTRFFPSITKSHPHIHRSLNCRTLHYGTQMRWEPALSGKTDEVAVAELDEALCSVCFPDAPVALHNHVSKRTLAEQAVRAAEKDARDAKKAAKTLTDEEQRNDDGSPFRNHHGDRVTTVASLKEIVRYAIELEVEATYWHTHSPEGWTEEHLARRRSNLAADLPKAYDRAGKAASILMLREQRHEGHGATMEEIAKIRANKERAARKAWGL